MADAQPTVVFTRSEWKELAKGLSLSPRQEVIGEMLVGGMSDQQIALHLKIKVPTVRTHINRLFFKSKVADRVEFVSMCFSLFRRNRGELLDHPS